MKIKWNIMRLDWNISEKGQVVMVVGTFFFILALTIFASDPPRYFDAFLQFYSTYLSLIGSSIPPTSGLLVSLGGLDIELSRADRTKILGTASIILSAILLVYGSYVIYKNRYSFN